MGMVRYKFNWLVSPSLACIRRCPLTMSGPPGATSAIGDISNWANTGPTHKIELVPTCDCGAANELQSYPQQYQGQECG